MDVLITEGTNLTREDNYLTEEELAQQAGELMQQHKLIFCLCASTNFYAFTEFFTAWPDVSGKMYC